MRAFLGVVVFALLLPIASKAEVLAVCGSNTARNASLYGSNVALRSDGLGGAIGVPEMTSLALWRDADGFDLLLDWGQRDQVSLRAEGAEIMGNEMGPDFFHLMVARAGAHDFEHFIFNLDTDSGQLIWTGTESGSNSGETAPFETSCRKPD